MQFCAPSPCPTFLFFKVVRSADAEKGEGWDEDSRWKKILTLPSPFPYFPIFEGSRVRRSWPRSPTF